MRILCIDTSSEMCGVAILENANLIDKIEQKNGLTHSQTLMPIIKNILNKNNLKLCDINLLVCNIGPGSFTGIRIGIASVKAFADSLNLPCVGINSLEVLAHNIKEDGLICSTIDCKNDNCYFALYKLENTNFSTIIEPQATSISDVYSILSNYNNSNIHFVGNGLKEHLENADLHIENLGIAGFKKFEISECGKEILPMYLKKPQAEIQLENSMQKKTKNLTITKMTIEDLNSIKSTLEADFDDFWTFNILKDELNCNTSHFLVAKNESNKIVGFAGFKTICDNADIMNIVVEKNSRNAGIGTLLLENIINLCKNYNLKTVTLEVNENNNYALQLYKKFKFKKSGIRPKYYNNSENAIIMTKNINSFLF